MIGEMGILNIGAGDTKLIFDVKDPDSMAKGARIVEDMIRRGYTIMVEVERAGKKVMRRVKKFKKDTYEYVITAEPSSDATAEAATGAPPKEIARTVPIASARAVAIGHRAGG